MEAEQPQRPARLKGFCGTKTHLAFGKIGLFYEQLHRCILG
jgi:hypothetical protein